MTHASTQTSLLRLVALDPEDLAVFSANLQDAQISVAEFSYMPQQRRFAFAGKRFDWAKAVAGGCERCETGAHFDFVRSVSRVGFEQSDMDRVLNLLAVHFKAAAAPAGIVTLTFSGGAAIKLDVECVDAQMRDLGPRWPCDCEPKHPVEDGS